MLLPQNRLILHRKTFLHHIPLVVNRVGFDKYSMTLWLE